MTKSSTPYYLLAGDASTEIPGSATLKDVGGKVIIGKYYVVHRNRDGERYPWVVYEKTTLAFTPSAPGQETTEDGFDHVEIDTFAQYREAIRAAKKLDRQHLVKAGATAVTTPGHDTYLDEEARSKPANL